MPMIKSRINIEYSVYARSIKILRGIENFDDLIKSIVNNAEIKDIDRESKQWTEITIRLKNEEDLEKLLQIKETDYFYINWIKMKR